MKKVAAGEAKGHFVIGKNTKRDGKFRLVFCTECATPIRILMPDQETCKHVACKGDGKDNFCQSPHDNNGYLSLSYLVSHPYCSVCGKKVEVVQ